jgi:hypothetical protein
MRASDLSNIAPIVPTIVAKTPHAIIMTKIATTFSSSLTAYISPYPTVDIVAKAQKNEWV